jgi:hypothetical protein
LQVQNGLRAAVEMANAAAKDSVMMAHPSVAARNMFDAVARIAIAQANRSVAVSCGFFDFIRHRCTGKRYFEVAHAQTLRFQKLFLDAVRLAR